MMNIKIQSGKWRRNFMKKRLLFVFVLLVGVFLAACGGDKESTSGTTADGEKKITLKMANITQASNEFSLTLERIGEELSKRTDGRITASYFPAGQLGNESDMMQQLNTGSLDMAIITTAQLSNSSPAFGAWLMPFIVDTHEQAYELWTSEESMSLFDTLTGENVKGLGYASTGFRFILSTKPITEVKDFNGYKLRTTPSPTILDYWNSLKASPTPMPLTEVYTSLQTGVIDGVDIDSESLVTENLSEIATHMTPDKHMYWAGGLMINKDLWNSLSAEDQKLIQEVVDEATKKNSEQVAANEKDLLENGEKKMGITIHELKDRKEFDSYVKKVEDTWIEKSPEIAKFLDKARSITGK
jgi:TRAP-type transport system periplasmic protein